MPLLLVPKSCLTLCNPMSSSPPGFSVHGISQARILERVDISFSSIFVCICVKIYTYMFIYIYILFSDQKYQLTFKNLNFYIQFPRFKSMLYHFLTMKVWAVTSFIFKTQPVSYLLVLCNVFKMMSSRCSVFIKYWLLYDDESTIFIFYNGFLSTSRLGHVFLYHLQNYCSFSMKRLSPF